MALFGALSSLILLTGCNMNFKDFKAITLTRSSSFELDMSPEYALPLFTAPGEKLWISVWDPIVLNGDGLEKGTVWVTTNHGTTSHWYVADYNIDTKHAQYMRTTPGADIGTVDVSMTSNGNDGSIVQVTYQLTGLSESGNKSIEQKLSESEYAKMMQEWRTMINSSRKQIDEHFGS